MTAAVILLGVAVGLLGLLVVGLLRSHADVLRALHDLGVSLDGESATSARSAAARSQPKMRTAIGVPEPGPAGGRVTDLSGVTPRGDSVVIGVGGADHRTLLAFLSSGCLTCQNFWSIFDDPGAIDLPDDFRLVIVTHGTDQESPSAIADLAPRGVPLVMSSAAWDDYDAPVSPYFVLVDGPTSRILGEGASAEWTQVRNLMVNAVKDQESLGLTTRGRRPDPDANQALDDAGIVPGDQRLRHDPIAEDR
jgi:hypothetical protein